MTKTPTPTRQNLQAVAAMARSAPVNLQHLSVSSGESVKVARDGHTIELPKKKYGPSAYAATAATVINDTNSPIQWPFVTGVPISSGFGYRVAPCGGCSSYHDGLDMNPGGSACRSGRQHRRQHGRAPPLWDLRCRNSR